jgi:hypothetical protein
MPAGWNRLRWLLLLLPLVICAATAIVVLYRVDPSHSDRYPKCTFHWLTGLHCPGCGATRAVHALLHGRLLEALQFNALLIVGVPCVLAFAFWRHRWGIGQFKTAVAAWTIAIVVIAFAVVRNIPNYPFELLAPPRASSSAAEMTLERKSPSASAGVRAQFDRGQSVGTAR